MAQRRPEISLGNIIARYLEGYYPYWNRKVDRFYWDRLPDRTIVRLEDASVRAAKRMLARLDHVYVVQQSGDLDEVLAALTDESSRPETWVVGPVLEVYQQLAAAQLLHTFEVRSGGQLRGAMVVILLPGVCIAETMWARGDSRWASKAALCEGVISLADRGYRIIDVQVPHAYHHPSARLGEVTMPIDDYVKEVRAVIRGIDGGALERKSLHLRLMELRSEGMHVPGIDVDVVTAWGRAGLAAQGTNAARDENRVAGYDPRTAMSFPAARDAWRTDTPVIRRGDGVVSLELCGFQVMQSWEDRLMYEMARVAGRPGATVLEVGYGLGICARHLQAQHVAFHVIVEANREIADHARADLADQIARGRVLVLEGFWEDLCEPAALRSLANTAEFDGIVFDTFPHTARELRRNHFPFFKRAAELLGKNGSFTYFSDEVVALPEDHIRRIYETFGDVTISQSLVDVKPPVDCEYWSADTIVHVAVTRDVSARRA